MALDRNGPVYQEIRRRLFRYDDVRKISIGWKSGRIDADTAMQEIAQIFNHRESE